MELFHGLIVVRIEKQIYFKFTENKPTLDAVKKTQFNYLSYGYNGYCNIWFRSSWRVRGKSKYNENGFHNKSIM